MYYNKNAYKAQEKNREPEADHLDRLTEYVRPKINWPQEKPDLQAQPAAETAQTVSAAQNETVLPDMNEPMPETIESELYIPGYLNTQLGQYMRVEFLIGNQLTDRTGRLVKVGASYIILQPQDANLVVCDLFAIKFVTIVRNANTII